MTTEQGVDPGRTPTPAGHRQQIAAVFEHFPPYPSAGAIRAEHFASQIAARLPAGEELVILTTVSGSRSPGAAHRHRIIPIGSDPVDNRRSLVRRAVGELMLGLRAGWRLLRLRPRLVVLSSPGYIFAMIVAVTARLARLPYVLDVRDIYPEAYTAAGLLPSGSLIARLLSALSGFVYRGAAFVAAATEGLGRQIQAQAPGTAVHVIYNGYPTALRDREPSRKLDRFTCSFHGVLGFYQDARALLALARALQPHDVDVVVIGYGRGEEVFADDPPANLTVIGRRPFAETIAMVERAHVGLCLRTDDPISRDALPVKMFEYVALGLPTVVTPPSEAGRFVERYHCGSVFEAGDIDGMTAEILRMRDDPAYYLSIVEACAGIGEEFTREFQAARFAELVQAADLAGRASIPAGQN